jgi:pimeloyl-ACP methyl ester carboxylesterase
MSAITTVSGLRALPDRAVLVDARGYAWQMRTARTYAGALPPVDCPALMVTGSDAFFDLSDDEDAESALEDGPFTLVWTPDDDAGAPTQEPPGDFDDGIDENFAEGGRAA